MSEHSNAPEDNGSSTSGSNEQPQDRTVSSYSKANSNIIGTETATHATWEEEDTSKDENDRASASSHSSRSSVSKATPDLMKELTVSTKEYVPEMFTVTLIHPTYRPVTLAVEMFTTVEELQQMYRDARPDCPPHIFLHLDRTVLNEEWWMVDYDIHEGTQIGVDTWGGEE